APSGLGPYKSATSRLFSSLLSLFCLLCVLCVSVVSPPAKRSRRRAAPSRILRGRIARRVKEDQRAMADQESGGKKSGWCKTSIGTLAGLCSGAAVMYLTPLVNRVIQPAKPVANFSVEHDGLTVRVQDLSNVHQGHWDFGDGTPLVPVSSDDTVLSHTFPGPGEYTITWSLQNILNDENERSVVVKLEGGAAAAAAPAAPHVSRFDAVAVGSSTYAPASFRLTAETLNAEMCVLEMGDGRKEFMKHPAASSERVVTFDKPGHSVVKLV